MKNYFALTFALGIYLGGFAQIEKPENLKSGILEKLHRLIERTDIKTIRTGFQKICEENNLPSIVSGLKDGTYNGVTPFDDYDEIHRGGHAKHTMKIIATECFKVVLHLQ